MYQRIFMWTQYYMIVMNLSNGMLVMQYKALPVRDACRVVT